MKGLSREAERDPRNARFETTTGCALPSIDWNSAAAKRPGATLSLRDSYVKQLTH